MGQAVEQAVRRYLEAQGLHFREANYHCKMGEIDLVMIDEATLVFVEVRYRLDSEFCHPLETITRSKQRKIIRAASHYLVQRLGSHDVACRFDVVGVTESDDKSLQFQWIPQAFY